MEHKNKYFSFLLHTVVSAVILVSGFLRVSPVSASPLPLYTAYPTLTPIGATQTNIPPVSTMNFACPVGAPYGWGTVTPSIDWLYSCGQCSVTSTPSYLTPTPFFNGTGTPPSGCDPYGTGTPVPTVPAGTPQNFCQFPTTPIPPTSIPPSSPISCNSSNGATCEEINAYTIKFTFNQNGTIDLGYTLPDNTSSAYYKYSGLNYWVSSTGSYIVAIAGDLEHWVTSRTDQEIVFPCEYNSIPSCRVPIGATVQQLNNLTKSSDGVISPSINDSRFFRFLPRRSGGNTGGTYSVLWSGSLYVSTSPINLNAPTPSPTPTINPNYCGSVSSSSVPNQFSLSGTGAIVEQSCFTTPELNYADLLNAVIPDWLGGFDDWFISIFPIDIVIPPQTVCIRQRDFSLYLFGVRIPVEMALSIMIFTAGLRLILPMARAENRSSGEK